MYVTIIKEKRGHKLEREQGVYSREGLEVRKGRRKDKVKNYFLKKTCNKQKSKAHMTNCKWIRFLSKIFRDFLCLLSFSSFH